MNIMSQSRIFALLTGIDEYAPESKINQLYGCVNDVLAMEKFLERTYPASQLFIRRLINEQATYTELIQSFRTHFREIQEGDTAFFYYGGHGSQNPTAKELLPYDRLGKDQTIVCYDSRLEGKWDLADKELAVLIHEVAEKGAHVVIMMDSCHSGSVTREVDGLSLLGPRYISGREQARPLATYLDGFYSRNPEIPNAKHILLAAAARDQRAWESADRRGIFTQSVLEVLESQLEGISYTDLFYKVRTLVSKKVYNQTPQFETYQFFPAHDRFLGGKVRHTAPRFQIYYDRDSQIKAWVVNAGAFHRFPTDVNQSVELAIYKDQTEESPIVNTRTKVVGTHKSTLDFSYPYTDKTFIGELLSIPRDPTFIFAELAEALRFKLLQMSETQFGDLALAYVKEEGEAAFVIRAEGNHIYLERSVDRKRIVRVEGGTTEEIAYFLLNILQKVLAWENILELKNHRTQFQEEDIELIFSRQLVDGSFKTFEDEMGQLKDSIVLPVEKKGSTWETIPFKIEARNSRPMGSEPLYAALLYISHKFGVRTLFKGLIPPTPEGENTILFHKSSAQIGLQPSKAEIKEHFKLIVSTHEIDSFIVEQGDIEENQLATLGQDARMGEGKGITGINLNRITFDWFTKGLAYTVIKVQDQISEQEVVLSGGQLKVKGHSDIHGSVYLRPFESGARNLGAMDSLAQLMEKVQATPVQFESSSGEKVHYIEITDLPLDYDFKQNPLRLELNVPIEEAEEVVALTMDGGFIMPFSAEKLGDKMEIPIEYIPDSLEGDTRSLGKALKMAFFKIALRRNTQLLRWVTFHEDGTITREEEGLAEKVGKAKRILLCIHGIIGDTEGMTRALNLMLDTNGYPFAKLKHYDLVLTFDYENLNTPIETTAIALKKQLEQAGIHAEMEKELTILAHSMGGLIARWMVEREWGYKFVKHLIMTGVPNHGSPFGKMTDYQAMFIQGMNFLKNFVPIVGTVGGLLAKTEELTKTLAEIRIGSSFLKRLNSSEDPGITYSFVCGDIQHYQIPDGTRLQQLHDKLFLRLGAHIIKEKSDAAVSLDSMQQVTKDRKEPLQIVEVPCHHMAYFSTRASLKELEKFLCL